MACAKKAEPRIPDYSKVLDRALDLIAPAITQAVLREASQPDHDERIRAVREWMEVADDASKFGSLDVARACANEARVILGIMPLPITDAPAQPAQKVEV